MKTFKTITFVTATTAVVSVVTLFSVEQTKIGKDNIVDDPLKSGVVEERDPMGNFKTFPRDTIEIISKGSNTRLSETKPLKPDTKIYNDTLNSEGVFSK